jgi:hypothetical protein
MLETYPEYRVIRGEKLRIYAKSDQNWGITPFLLEFMTYNCVYASG